MRSLEEAGGVGSSCIIDGGQGRNRVGKMMRYMLMTVPGLELKKGEVFI
jgi:hypothetical protein